MHESCGKHTSVLDCVYSLTLSLRVVSGNLDTLVASQNRDRRDSASSEMSRLHTQQSDYYFEFVWDVYHA